MKILRCTLLFAASLLLLLVYASLTAYYGFILLPKDKEPSATALILIYTAMLVPPALVAVLAHRRGWKCAEYALLLGLALFLLYTLARS